MNKIKTFLKHAFFQLLVLFVISSTVFAGQIRLTWNASAEPVSGYRLYYGLSSGNYTDNVDVGKVTTYTLTELQDGLTYYIAATAYNNAGESGYSNEASGEPTPDDITPPADVSNFQAIPGDGRVTLSWINPPDGDFAGTMIRYRTDGIYPTDHTDGAAVNNGNDGKFLNNPGSNDSFVHNGLQNGTTYYYLACTYDGVSNYSETAHASATPTAPGPPLDTTDPTVAMTSPTSGPSYSTGEDTISLGGSASDNVGVTIVTWTNSRGGSGTASGTDSWTISNIPLHCGADNIITVTAKDAANNTASVTLTIDVKPCPVSGFGLQ